MPNFIFLAFIYFIEGFIVYSYIQSIYSPKKSNSISFTITIFLYFTLLLVYRFVFNNEIFNTFLIIIINILIVFSLYKSSLKSAIFHGFALGISQLLSEFISLYLVAAFLKTETQSVMEHHFEIATILSKILYFLISRLLILFSIKENKSRSWGKWFGLSLLPLSSIAIVISFRVITNNIILEPFENTFLIFSTSFLLLVNIIVYLTYEKAEKSNQKLLEFELINQKNNIDMQYLQLLEKKNETMNIMAHNYKNHIVTIGNMSDSPEIKKYINKMFGEITVYNQIAKTKNRLLDVILSKYIDICNDKNIKFEIDVMTDNLSFINSYDISSLFNNILDNAVEAASLSSGRYIHLEITASLNSYHKIIAINSCDNEPHSEKGKLITTKRNKNVHGFGTKSIRKIVNKYDGEFQWEYDNQSKQFKLIILLPDEQQNN